MAGRKHCKKSRVIEIHDRKKEKPLIRGMGWFCKETLARKLIQNVLHVGLLYKHVLAAGLDGGSGSRRSGKWEWFICTCPFSRELALCCSDTQDQFTLWQRRLQAISFMSGSSRLAPQSLKLYILLYKPLCRMYFCDICEFQSFAQGQLCPIMCPAGDKGILKNLHSLML